MLYYREWILWYVEDVSVTCASILFFFFFFSFFLAQTKPQARLWSMMPHSHRQSVSLPTLIIPEINYRRQMHSAILYRSLRHVRTSDTPYRAAFLQRHIISFFSGVNFAGDSEILSFFPSSCHFSRFHPRFAVLLRLLFQHPRLTLGQLELRAAKSR